MITDKLKQLIQEEIERLANINEVPIGDFETVGDFSKKLSFSNPVDRKLLTSPKAQVKIKKMWENTPITFNMMFINTQNAKDYKEVGVVSKESLERMFGPEVTEKIDPNACTIIFTNNSGDERVMATGWILAHRLGHAINASNRFAGKAVAPNLVQSWELFRQQLRTLFVQILDQVYDITVYEKTNAIDTKQDAAILKLAAQQLGTMKSARDSNLRNWYEFSYEVFAQYLLTGKIKLNQIPDEIVVATLPFGRKRTRGVMYQGHQKMYNRHDLEYYSNELESILESLVEELQGKIFVM